MGTPAKPAAGDANELTLKDGGSVIESPAVPGDIDEGCVCRPSEDDIGISVGLAAPVFVKEGDAAEDVNGGEDGGESEVGGSSTKV